MKSLAHCRLYGILDLGYVKSEQIKATAELMLKGGVDLLQLRAKTKSEQEIEALASQLTGLTEAAGVPLIINDHPQIVPSVGAQGAHVGQDDFSVEEARWRAGRPRLGKESAPIVGKSTHSFAQAVAAEAEAADYIGFGPLFPTLTKPGRSAIGLEEIRRVHEAVRIPIFCIGGIHRENLEEVLRAGARRVVMVSGILRASDVLSYCQEVKATLEQFSIDK